LKVLVTGGAGFIGSHVIDCLLERGHSVRVLDALVSQVHGDGRSRPDYLKPAVEVAVGKVEDAASTAHALQGIDSVIHLASAVGVGQSMYQIVDYCTTNVLGTANLLQTILDKRVNLKSFVVASSMSSYGEGRYCTVDGQLINPGIRKEAQLARGDWNLWDSNGERLEPMPTDEEKPLNPTSVYAINKRDQEEMCLSVGSAYDIPTTALRLFNVYGSRQALSNPYTGVAAIFCARLLHSKDVARAFVSAAENPAAGEAINIGSGESLSVVEIAEVLSLEMKKNIPPRILGKYRRGDIRHCFADISKARRLLAWEPSKTFREGVPELVEWVQKQREVKDRVDSAWSELENRGLLS
jgi:dTDP-L-rhamnose 4-epimerase